MEPYQNRADRPRVYMGTDGTVPYRTASGTRTGPPKKKVPQETESKSSHINSQNRSRQVRLETRQGEIRLRIADDNWRICSRRTLCVRLRRTNVWWDKFFQEFFMFLMNGERGCRLELFMRECCERNGSVQNGSKASCKEEAYPYLRETVPYRTVPKSRVNAALCKLPPIKTMNFGLDSISFRGSFLWNTLDDSIKREKTLACFHKRIGKWSGARCTCEICH